MNDGENHLLLALSYSMEENDSGHERASAVHLCKYNQFHQTLGKIKRKFQRSKRRRREEEEKEEEEKMKSEMKTEKKERKNSRRREQEKEDYL